jgi:hypothetical protein
MIDNNTKIHAIAGASAMTIISYATNFSIGKSFIIFGIILLAYMSVRLYFIQREH